MPRPSLFGNLDISKKKEPINRQSVAVPAKEEEKEEGGLLNMAGDFAKGLAKPFVKAAVTGLAAVEDTARLATGAYDENTTSRTASGYNVPGFGQVAPNRIGKDIVKDEKTGEVSGGGFGRETIDTIGTGADIGSWYGGGKGMNLLRQGLKGAGWKALKPLALAEGKLGMATGLAGAAGNAAQQEEATAQSIAGAGIMGMAFGGPLGFASPYVGKGLGRVWNKMKGWNEAADQVIEGATAMKKAEQSSAEVMGRAPVQEVGPTTPFTETVTPVAPSGPTSQVPSLSSLGEDVEEFFPQAAPDARPVEESLRKKAVNLGFKEWQPTLISEMSQAERDAARQMLSMAEDKSGNILAKHPMEKAAEPILDQVEHLRTVRNTSGAALDGLVDQMPKNPIPLDEPIQATQKWLDNNKIKIVFDEMGNPKLDFKASKFTTSADKRDREVLQEVFDELFPPQAKGQAIHRTPEEIRTIRQRLFKLLEKQKVASDPFSGSIEDFISSLRKELNKPLAALSPEYAQMNQNFAVATDALETFYKFLGKDFYDASKKDMMNRVQELLPRLVSNTASKPGVIFQDVLNAATKTGMPEQAISDPRRLVYFANLLDNTYDLNAPRGFQGSIENAGLNILQKVGKGIGGVKDIATGSPIRGASALGELFTPDVALKRKKLLKQMLDEGAPSSVIPDAIKREGNQEALGAVAGIEPEFDEEGNPVGMKYDPVKGALGVAGGIAVKKLKGEKIQAPKPIYGMSHRPSFDGMPPAHNLLEGDTLPRDVYDKPEFSIAGGRNFKKDKAAQESWKAIQSIKDKPDAEITIYRASPKNELNPGDWVTFSKTYAEDSVEGAEKVYAHKVKAKDVIFAGDDINEFGYYPSEVTTNASKAFEGFEDLSLKTLEKLKGRTTVSKQFIEDLAKTPDLKQAERDVINEALAGIKGKDVNVQEFADKVKAELLPLNRKTSALDMTGDRESLSSVSGDFSPRYENIGLPSDVRGDVVSYAENIYESPIKTSAGSTHFSGTTNNYFGHTRVEDVADMRPLTKQERQAIAKRQLAGENIAVPSLDAQVGGTRRVIEVQSDLYQRGRLESELVDLPKKYKDWEYEELTNKIKSLTKDNSDPDVLKELKKIKNEFDTQIQLHNRAKPLQQYSNPTAHFRMIREEVKRAAQDGKTKLQFPTGETAMKIEGLGERPSFRTVTYKNDSFYPGEFLKPEDLKVGMDVNDHHGNWVITDVLGDGKFKAVPAQSVSNYLDEGQTLAEYMDTEAMYKRILEKNGDTPAIREWAETQVANKKKFLDQSSETFDISGKVDKENPIYKFYDKEVSKYLKSKYNAKPVTDARGVTWMEVDVKPEMGKGPVEAFAAVPLAGAGAMGAEEQKKKKKRSK